MSVYSTVSVKKDTKTKASQQASNDGITLSAVVRILLNDYAEGRIVIGAREVRTENGFTPEFEEEVLRASGEGSYSPTFDNAEDAIDYLHKAA